MSATGPATGGDDRLIAQFMDSSRQQGLSDASKRRKVAAVQHFSRWLTAAGKPGLLGATTADVTGWQESPELTELTWQTRITYLGSLHAFYEFAVKWDIRDIPTAPLRHYTLGPRRPKRQRGDQRTLYWLTMDYSDGRRKRGEITDGTARNSRSHLGGLAASFGARPVDQLGRAAVERWQETIGHLAPASRRTQLSTVKGFCRWLVEQGLIKRDPTVGLPAVRQPRRIPRALPHGDAATFLEALPDDRARAIIWLMVGLGLRCCEVANLQVADYDQRARSVFVTGKGGHQRGLPVPDPVARALTAYLAGVGATSGPLIRSIPRPWAGIKAESISTMVSRWMGDAGIKRRQRDGVSAHALRHTAASDVLDRCHDLRVVQQMLGHSNLSTTSIYLRRVDLGEMREAMAGREYRTVTGPGPPMTMPYLEGRESRGDGDG